MNKFKNYLKDRIFLNNITNKFFTLKKILFFIFGFVLFLTALGLNFYFFKINISQIFTDISVTIKNYPILVLMLIFLLIYPFFTTIYLIAYIKPRVEENNLHISILEYVILSFKVRLINVVTPFSTGSQPYVIYWLTSRGMSIEQANKISLMNGVLTGLSEILITIPSLIYICLTMPLLFITPLGISFFWIILLGILVNILISFSFLILGLSKRAHYFISIIWNLILSKLKIKHLKKEKIYNKYIVEAVFRKAFLLEFKKIKTNLFICFFYILMSFAHYTSVYFSFILIIGKENVLNFNDFIYIFNIANISVTANNFFPIPGAEGGIQTALLFFIDAKYGSNNLLVDIGNSGGNIVGFWRITTTYFPIIWSLLIVSIYYFLKLYFIDERDKDNKKKRNGNN